MASDWLLFHLHHKPTRHCSQSQLAGFRGDQSESESTGEYLMLQLNSVILSCFSKMFCPGPQLMIVKYFRVGPTANNPPHLHRAHMVLHNTNILGGRILLILCNINRNRNIMCRHTDKGATGQTALIDQSCNISIETPGVCCHHSSEVC